MFIERSQDNKIIIAFRGMDAVQLLGRDRNQRHLPLQVVLGIGNTML